VITLSDLLPLVEALRRLQLDQVRSVADRDTDEDCYNYSHLITIKQTLKRFNDDDFNGFDFGSDIQFIRELLSDRANEVMNG
jgi:hypothetical protein